MAVRGPRHAVVGMMTGCVQSAFFPDVNAATVRVLTAEGCDMVRPHGRAAAARSVYTLDALRTCGASPGG